MTTIQFQLLDVSEYLQLFPQLFILKANFPLHVFFFYYINNKALKTNGQCHLRIPYSDTHKSGISLLYELIILFCLFI